jgi:hypothetical protein
MGCPIQSRHLLDSTPCFGVGNSPLCVIVYLNFVHTASFIVKERANQLHLYYCLRQLLALQTKLWWQTMYLPLTSQFWDIPAPDLYRALYTVPSTPVTCFSHSGSHFEDVKPIHWNPWVKIFFWVRVLKHSALAYGTIDINISRASQIFGPCADVRGCFDTRVWKYFEEYVFRIISQSICLWKYMEPCFFFSLYLRSSVPCDNECIFV